MEQKSSIYILEYTIVRLKLANDNSQRIIFTGFESAPLFDHIHVLESHDSINRKGARYTLLSNFLRLPPFSHSKSAKTSPKFL